MVRRHRASRAHHAGLRRGVARALPRRRGVRCGVRRLRFLTVRAPSGRRGPVPWEQRARRDHGDVSDVTRRSRGWGGYGAGTTADARRVHGPAVGGLPGGALETVTSARADRADEGVRDPALLSDPVVGPGPHSTSDRGSERVTDVNGVKGTPTDFLALLPRPRAVIQRPKWHAGRARKTSLCCATQCLPLLSCP